MNINSDDNHFSRFRIFYILPAFVFCIFLAFRPIVGEFADNDTGRYVISYFETCSEDVSFDFEARVTWETFNLFIRPLCLFDNERVYLFFIAALVPLGFIFLGVRSGNDIWMLYAYLLSHVGFEFMTNAFRQSASVFFLILAFRFQREILGLLCFGLFSLLLHDSAIVFVPVFFLIRMVGTEKIRWSRLVVFLIFLALIFGAVFWNFSSVYLSEKGGGFDGLTEVFTEKYLDQQSLFFQLYTIIPFAWVFLVKKFVSNNNLAREEFVVFFYSLFVCIFTSIFFSYITYRFAMTAFVFQMVYAMRSRAGFEMSGPAVRYIFSGVFIHQLVYLFFSKNIDGLLNGA